MKKRILSLLLILCMAVTLLPTAAFAEEATGVVVPKGQAKIGDTMYDTLDEAMGAVNEGDTATIYLGEGTYSGNAANPTDPGKGAGKNLTFVGAGTGETTWQIQAVKQYDADGWCDYSFKGSDRITFENMTVVGSVYPDDTTKSNNTQGLTYINHITLKDCVFNGRADYWGYESTTFENVTFNAPGTEASGVADSDYSLWTYTGKEYTFKNCTFNSKFGKIVNVYRHSDTGYDIVVNFEDCTVISSAPNKSVLNIKDSNNNYTINFSGINKVTGLNPNGTTCSRWFQVQSVGEDKSHYATVKIDGTTVWQGGEMVSHAIDTTNDKYTDGYKDNAFTTDEGAWTTNPDGTKTRTITKTCNYCGYQEQVEETKALCPVKLVIYRNGDTSKPYEIFDLENQLDGTDIDLSTIDIGNYYTANYTGKYDFYGWYNDGKWNDYMRDPANPPAGLEKITVNGWTNLKCMVYDYENVVYFRSAEDLAAYQEDHSKTDGLLYSTTALFGSTLPTANAPTPKRTGYTFKFWSREGQSVDVTGQTVNGWTNLYANWEKDESQTKTTSYTVQHKVDGKIIEEDTQTYTNTAWINETDPTIAIVPGSLSPKSYDGYKYVGMEPEIITDTVASGTIITLTYEKRTDLSYTVHYYLKGTTKKVADDKTVNGQTFNDVVEEEAIRISGYRVHGDSVKSITIGTGTNEIIFYYTRASRPSASSTSKPTLNTGDHYAYVMGYPDGTVRPNGSITRAEVSAILFRLLSDKTRDEYFTTESSFTDVKAGAWYNNSIATLEKAGVIVDTAKGGAFRPNEAITRAELAAMLAQFSDAKPVKGVKFSDVSAEHWAYEAIAIAAKMGWIEGYPDGTFRPDATITRAEMMTLVNRALERVPSDEDHLLSKRVMLTFPDCKSGDWFYIAVQEATNSHTYERAATEKNGDEQWTALRANRDWTRYEH